MSKIRFRYTKTGRAKYISHLDLVATFQRSFRRAGIELKYSEGFNPHPYMSVALPLPVGQESLCEMIDIALIDDIVPDIKKLKLPDGIVVADAYLPSRKFSEIGWIEICVGLNYNRQVDSDFIESIKHCFCKDSIVISKRTKRGFSDLDIAPHIKNVEVSYGENVMLKAMISAQNPTINADDLLNSLDDELKPNHIDVRRIEIYDTNMIVFN